MSTTAPLPARLAAEVRGAAEAFVQGVLDHPGTADRGRQRSPEELWRDALRLVFRLVASPGTIRSESDDPPGACRMGRIRALDQLGPDDLGRVYEALVHLDAGLATEPMVRLRRGDREAVIRAAEAPRCLERPSDRNRRRTVVRRVEDIAPEPGSPGRFYVHAGFGRKTSGSYYTPTELVRFLVRETLGPLAERLSPAAGPRPGDLLRLTVLDPAMGGGCFLLEACRFLGERLEAACRACAVSRRWDRVPPEVAAHLADGTAEGRPVLAACKALVASRCLYGVDRDEVAVDVARAALSLEAGPDAVPWTILERHLVPGDSLTGPFAADLPHLRAASAARPTKPVEERFRRRFRDALAPTSGAPLAPFRTLAAAWAGAVALWPDRMARAAYAQLFARVAERGALPNRLTPAARRLLALGADLAALPFDLLFPEVFHPGGGFDAVLCNPPWEALRPAEKEFFAAYDPTVLDAPTARERRARVAELLQDPAVAARWSAYRGRIEAEKACHDRLYRWQKVRVGDDLAGRYSDLYRVFAERAATLVRPGGRVGLVLPAAFHANEGATGVRRLYLEEMALQCCYSFENRRRLFPIDIRCKFALVVAARGGPTAEFPCAFYLQDPASLANGHRHLRYGLDFVRRTGGDYLSFVEARDPGEVRLLQRLLPAARTLGSLEATHGLVIRTEPYAFNVTTHSPLFTPAAGAPPPGHLPLVEGKSFHQFTDRWEAPRYTLSAEAAARRPAALPNARFFRLAFRTVAHATNERTALATVLPPGVLVSNSVAVEAAPERRPNRVALWACAVLNSFAFDFTVRVRGGANMNLFLMRSGLLPARLPEAFLAHGALRLVCNHAGFAPLWREQVGEAWRESGKLPGQWPLLAGEEERWQVRSALDAAVAAAYGLSREEYARLLGTFRHRSQPQVPEWCLEMFDEYTRLGEEAFLRRNDPYRDVSPP